MFSGKAIVEDFNFSRVFIGKVAVREIARIMDAHGDRLLERNVRGYLGLQGGQTVNLGIRNTLTSTAARRARPSKPRSNPLGDAANLDVAFVLNQRMRCWPAPPRRAMLAGPFAVGLEPPRVPKHRSRAMPSTMPTWPPGSMPNRPGSSDARAWPAPATPFDVPSAPGSATGLDHRRK